MISINIVMVYWPPAGAQVVSLRQQATSEGAGLPQATEALRAYHQMIKHFHPE